MREMTWTWTWTWHTLELLPATTGAAGCIAWVEYECGPQTESVLWNQDWPCHWHWQWHDSLWLEETSSSSTAAMTSRTPSLRPTPARWGIVSKSRNQNWMHCCCPSCLCLCLSLCLCGLLFSAVAFACGAGLGPRARAKTTPLEVEKWKWRWKWRWMWKLGSVWLSVNRWLSFRADWCTNENEHSHTRVGWGGGTDRVCSVLLLLIPLSLCVWLNFLFTYLLQTLYCYFLLLWPARCFSLVGWMSRCTCFPFTIRAVARMRGLIIAAFGDRQMEDKCPFIPSLTQKSNAKCFTPKCQMPNAKCQMPNAKCQCQMPNAKCQCQKLFIFAELSHISATTKPAAKRKERFPGFPQKTERS